MTYQHSAPFVKVAAPSALGNAAGQGLSFLKELDPTAQGAIGGGAVGTGVGAGLGLLRSMWGKRRPIDVPTQMRLQRMGISPQLVAKLVKGVDDFGDDEMDELIAAGVDLDEIAPRDFQPIKHTLQGGLLGGLSGAGVGALGTELPRIFAGKIAPPALADKMRTGVKERLGSLDVNGIPSSAAGWLGDVAGRTVSKLPRQQQFQLLESANVPTTASLTRRGLDWLSQR